MRAGLTPKHIDVPELLSVLRYGAGPDLRLTPVTIDRADVFELADVPDVRLQRVWLGADPVVVEGSLIVLVTEGRAEVSIDGLATTTLDRGGSAFVPADHGVFTLTGAGTAFVVTPALKPIGRAR